MHATLAHRRRFQRSHLRRQRYPQIDNGSGNTGRRSAVLLFQLHINFWSFWRTLVAIPTHN